MQAIGLRSFQNLMPCLYVTIISEWLKLLASWLEKIDFLSHVPGKHFKPEYKSDPKQEIMQISLTMGFVKYLAPPSSYPAA